MKCNTKQWKVSFFDKSTNVEFFAKYQAESTVSEWSESARLKSHFPGALYWGDEYDDDDDDVGDDDDDDDDDEDYDDDDDGEDVDDDDDYDDDDDDDDDEDDYDDDDDDHANTQSCRLEAEVSLPWGAISGWWMCPDNVTQWDTSVYTDTT